MAIYRRKEADVWYADYVVDGRRVQESTGTTNKREAEKYLALRVSECSGMCKSNECLSRSRNYGSATALTPGRTSAPGLNNITPLRVKDYQHHRMRKVAPATVNRELGLLKHMFNMAERWSMFQGTNPVRLVKFLPEDILNSAR